MPGVPKTRDAITPEWLTTVLRQLPDTEARTVSEMVLEPVGEGIGFLSSMWRAQLKYEEPASTGPKSLVVKLESGDSNLRETAREFHAFEREVNFYRDVAPHCPIRVPRVYHALSNEEGGVIVMEDLGHLEVRDQVHGIRHSEALGIVRQIGRLQAHYWDNERLHALEWMPVGDSGILEGFGENWPVFEEAYGLRIGREAVDLGQRLAASLDWLVAKIAERPHTIVHTDLRADNVLFGPAGSDDEYVILDWQLGARTLGAIDPARLLGGSEPAAERGGHQLEVFGAWHEALVEGGVEGYSFEAGVEDFRLACLYCLCIPIRFLAVTGVDAGGRTGQLLDAISLRMFESALELGVSEILP
ncbi:MAG: phosphotransferase [Myxococcota bacterium]